MSNQKKLRSAQREIQIQEAITAILNKQFSSIRGAARHFQISHDTLSRRLNGGVSQAQSHEPQKILTNAEESTLVRWIKQYTIAGTPITYPLLKELAQLLRVARVRHASSQRPAALQLDPIGTNWLYRFVNRHSKIRNMFTRQLEYARFEGASEEKVNRWFDAIEEKFKEHSYNLSDVWNMDESGFGIGEEQAMKVLIHLDHIKQQKVIAGKQEWVSDIECINAAGEALPPLLIFKGEYMNTRWVSSDTPSDYHFATSKNGWTSNKLGLQWLMKVFEPLTREKAANRQRLLIADGHGSHVQADFIAYCMENRIDLLILPPHCSHILQPLDIGVFSSFKRFHTSETDAITRLSSQRISRVEWINLFSRARTRALSKENILSGFRGAGISPLNRRRILKNLPSAATISTIPPCTPSETVTLDLALLKSSPPEPVELCKSNKRFTETLRECNDVVSPVKRYAERMTRMCESQNATIAIMAKQLAETTELLRKRKRSSTGKRVQLEGVSVYSTANVLRVARDTEVKRDVKRPRGRPRKVPIREVESDNEEEVSDNSSDNSEVELESCVGRRTRSHA